MTPIDEHALQALLPRLRRFARSLAGDAAAADDLVQAALERALCRWHSRRDADALQPWLFSILYRQFVDEHRRTRRWQRVLALLGGQDVPTAPSPEQVLAGRLQLAAFAQLPAEQRALLQLVAVEGFSYRDAAAALGLPIGTVMSRLSRARDRLRAATEQTPPPTRRLRGVP